MRTQALRGRATVTAAAEAEYRDYLRVRDAKGGRRGGGHVVALALVTVSAVVLLALGFGVRVVGRPYVGDGLLTAGLIAGAVAAGAAVGDFAWLFAVAHRGRSTAPDGSDGHADPEIGRAREAWELALLERGMVPFLLDRIEAPCAAEGDSGPAR
ncbi:hypothetical protein [Streptomyces sp. NPDC005423]|uniref:hypothetical protein n=1 Tax=Streptomyces sp. NPDC005423 TaxID=3155343 RepID=UPI0033B2A3B5